MLQQLLIHQPEDPIPFMIKYFQEDNDNGEHSAAPLLLGALHGPPALLLGAPRGSPSSWEQL